jgi:hypothetical protein
MQISPSSNNVSIIRNFKDEEIKVDTTEAEILSRLYFFAERYSFKLFFNTYRIFSTSSIKKPDLSTKDVASKTDQHPYSVFGITLRYPPNLYGDGPGLIPTNPLTQLPEILSSLPHLYTLKLEWIPLTSLKHLPPIEILNITGARFQDLIGCPDTITNAKKIYFYYCTNLKSLEGLPHKMPCLKKLSVWYCPVQTLEGLPEMPLLDHLLCKETEIRNFSDTSVIPFSFTDNNSISPYKISMQYGEQSFQRLFRDIQRTLEFRSDLFPPSYLPYLDLKREEINNYNKVSRRNNYSWQQIITNFSTDPNILAVQYASGEKLSQFEQDRIWAEGTMPTLRMLIQYLPHDDQILQKLARRWEFPLSFDLNPEGSSKADEVNKADLAHCAICRRKQLRSTLKLCSNCWSRLKLPRWKNTSPYCYLENSSKLERAYLCEKHWVACDECKTLYCTAMVPGCDCGHSVCPDCHREDYIKEDSYCKTCFENIKDQQQMNRR